MVFIYILLAGLLGVLGHWMVRWSQKRTNNSFFEYLYINKGHTISSCFSIVGTVAFIYQGYSGEDLFTALLTAYTSGYTLDSMINKDSGIMKDTPIQNEINNDKNKELLDIIDD